MTKELAKSSLNRSSRFSTNKLEQTSFVAICRPRRGGFTLIELLVVVLIIGILAAVALPQYNKAVQRARFSEVASTFNSISKGIDMWLLENGYPSSTVKFSGNNPNARLDIAQTCGAEDSSYCYTKVGGWYVSCGATHCQISLTTSYNADKTTGNKWFGSSSIVFDRVGNNPWGLAGGILEYTPSSNKKDLCRWWKDMYGQDRVFNDDGTRSTACDAY